jgi:dipeptidyl aminopeptidase/acylaminoacyl peptidase
MLFSDDMTRAFAVTVLATLLMWSLPGRAIDDGALGEASLAWDRGDYVSALTTYLKVLPSATASEIESIALQTGELYTTTELTADGSAPRFSPDGRYLSYETGTGLKRTLRLASVDAATASKVELPGFSAAFSPDGSQMIYLKVTATPELEQEQTAVDSAPPAERAQRLALLNQTLSDGAIAVVRDIASGNERPIETGVLRKSAPVIAVDGTIVFSGAAGSAPLQI